MDLAPRPLHADKENPYGWGHRFPGQSHGRHRGNPRGGGRDDLRRRRSRRSDPELLKVIVRW